MKMTFTLILLAIWELATSCTNINANTSGMQTDEKGYAVLSANEYERTWKPPVTEKL